MAKELIGDIHIHYGVHGKGTPLVLLTGFTGSIDHYWQTLLPALTKSHQVLILDHRGAGKSDIPDVPYTIEMMADDAMGLIRHLQWERPSILGHSMGGAVALDLARRFGDEIDQLILVNTFPKVRERTVLVYQAVEQFLQEGYAQEKAIGLVLPWLFSEEYLEDPKQLEDVKRYFQSRQYSLIGFSRQLQAIFQFDARPWLKEIHSDTLVIGSEDDILTSPSQSEELAENILEARLAILKGGHCSHLEHPSILTRLILDFLSG